MTSPHFTDHQKQKIRKGICATPFCVKNRAKQKSFCWSCVRERYRQAHPIEYAFQVLRNNAKRRGKDFTLTLEQFTVFVKQNDYMNKKGTKCKSLQIDRIDESRGYHFDNIQAITLRENIYKYRKSKMDLNQAPF